MKLSNSTWWGPPKRFTIENADRKISWLELFYDLVYVLAIAKITHHLGQHFSSSGLLDYIYIFAIIFWGWINGSMYHDLHGTEGLRTRLLTLWQMLIVAALVITTSSSPDKLIHNLTIVLLIMQFYITYMWWSVGLYDKDHRKLNRPYTIIYLISFGLMASTLFSNQDFSRIVFFLALILNFIPPFISHRFLRKRSQELNLSSSMSERLGLFTIIIFGEVIAGIVGGISESHDLGFTTWINFTLSVVITFALWWLFFTLVSDRKCKPGLLNGSWLQILYIPTLIGLGLTGMAFSGLFHKSGPEFSHWIPYREIFGFALCLLLLGINAIMYFLEYPKQYQELKRKTQYIVYIGIGLLFLITVINLEIELPYFLLIILAVILLVIFLLNYMWYSGEASKMEE